MDARTRKEAKARLYSTPADHTDSLHRIRSGWGSYGAKRLSHEITIERLRKSFSEDDDKLYDYIYAQELRKIERRNTRDRKNDDG